jgi:hypothetical protein
VHISSFFGDIGHISSFCSTAEEEPGKQKAKITAWKQRYKFKSHTKMRVKV